MLRIISILGSALGNLIRPKTRLAKAIGPLILIKIALLVTVKVLWFGPMTHPVDSDDVAAQFTATPPHACAQGSQGDCK